MKIIQILIAPNDATWQGRLLGLGDDANFARESGSIKYLEAIHRVAMWRYRYFLRGLR